MKEMNQKMGTHKFRFSDMMPHSWLYKLKGISRSSSRKHLPSSPKRLSTSSSTDASSSRNSLRLSSSPYHLPQGSSSPPKSPFKRKLKRKTVYKPSSRLKLSSSSSSFNPHVPLTTSRNHRSKPTSPNSIILEPSLTSSLSHRSKPTSSNAIILEPSLTSSRNHRFKPSSANAPSDSTVGSSSDPLSLSSPSDQNYGFSRDLESHSVDVKNHHSVKKLDDDSEDPSNSSPGLAETVKKPPPLEIRTQQKLKKPKATSAGIRIRANSPRIARKKTKAGRTSPQPMKKEMAESFAIVLTSVDPERDFRESMVEMIVENKMKEQKDLEDLLACYLSLNSSEYHDIIIKAFEKTWFHLSHSM
ncbi:Transcription repressor OFP3 [Hirschfeldia incana]|nr:Transcription repressor OFP3 [Hirschfeldia incana]